MTSNTEIRLDLNCDMGEGFDDDALARDKALMPYISSANIACGYHGGNACTMVATVRQALAHGVAIGAHPGLADLEGFGRIERPINADEARAITLAQVGALQAITRAEGGRLNHVKPHGALYNMAAREPVLARAIAQAVAEVDPKLVLVGLAGSALVQEGKKMGLRIGQEVFADRTYQADGRLTPRSQTGAMIEDTQLSLQQVLSMVLRGQVTAVDGTAVPVQADTLCIHGDSLNALAFARNTRISLEQQGITIAAL